MANLITISRLSKALYLFTLFALPISAEIYKWVDEDGKVQYSDKPPAEKPFETKHYQSDEPSPDPEMQAYRKQLQLNALERSRKAEFEKQEQAEKTLKAKQRKQYCNRLKSQQLIDNSVSGWRTQNPDGTVTEWTSEQRKQYTENLTKNYQKYCKNI